MIIVTYTTYYMTQTQKGSNEGLFILTWTHSMQIFGEIPFVKLQNDTHISSDHTTGKRFKNDES